MRDNKSHGVDLSLKGPVFAIDEVGYQINGLTGDSQRLGNYKLGGWYDNARLTDFESGARKRRSWGVYGLFDQVLVPFGNLSGACFGMQFALVTGDRSTGFDHC
jgi:porin